MKRPDKLLIAAALICVLLWPGISPAVNEIDHAERNSQWLEFYLRVKVEKDYSTWQVYVAPEPEKSRLVQLVPDTPETPSSDRSSVRSRSTNIAYKSVHIARVIARVAFRFMKHWLREQLRFSQIN